MSFMDQFAKARSEVRKTAKTMPHLFHEWQVLQSRLQEFERAKQRLAEAQVAWDRVSGAQQEGSGA